VTALGLSLRSGSEGQDSQCCVCRFVVLNVFSIGVHFRKYGKPKYRHFVQGQKEIADLL